MRSSEIIPSFAMAKENKKTREQSARTRLTKARRIIVKIGSRALAEGSGSARGQSTATEPNIWSRLASDVATVTGASATSKRGKRKGKKQRSLVLVSSGAIAFGVKELGFRRRPKEMASLQAAAAAGQGILMHRYAEAFGSHGLSVAQVLLTHADLSHRDRANNARDALQKLLDLGAVPIINENDAVAVDEIRFGDNDALAAMVAPMCEADVVLLLSDVEGVLDPRGKRVSEIHSIDEANSWLKDGDSTLGTGGMRSKLEAAHRATLAGADVVIAAAHTPQVIQRVLAGEDIGTLLPGRGRRLRTRKHWIAYTLRPNGAAIVDAGAAQAISEEGRSVLCVGVLGIRGDFEVGDAITIADANGNTLARGLTRLSASDAARLASQRDHGARAPILIHRDDLVVLGKE